ncbi:flagellin N-terminal helical domain-containing protein [Rhizobium alvei]|uniref:Flagellin n=1 Tax=Rhizobium alvei TaxID=1132659 RepID=A0ABT8YHS0_9HYPH|nr:flagellin [Rhizobium alvei]MDO6963242.1 flagellin [Rhizobium alvei]
MTSIITNNPATAALATLRGISSQLEDSQNRISTGYRVETAKNNAAYWSIATTMRSDTAAISAVRDALALGAATADTAYSGLSQAADLLAEVKSRLVAAREPGVDRGKVGTEIEELKNQLMSTATSATFNAQNWVYYEKSDSPWLTGVKEVVGAFNRNSDNTVSVKVLEYGSNSVTALDPPFALIDASDATHGEFGILTSERYSVALGQTTGWIMLDMGTRSNSYSSATLPQQEITLTSATTDAELTEMLDVVDAMLLDVTDVAGTLGALATRINMQSEFADDLTDTIDKGVGRLVDADMNAESTRLKVLQGQQSLGLTSLSIANSNPQSVLKLLQ